MDRSWLEAEFITIYGRGDYGNEMSRMDAFLDGMTFAIYNCVNSEKRILIVDKNKEFVDILYNDLLIGGYRNIESVSNYKDALDRLGQRDFDIVLMDIFAPDFKGFEYVQEIRSLKPKIETFLMIEPELQPEVNGKIKGKIKSDCLLKSNLAKQLIGHLEG